MTPVPLDLPLHPNEAAELAGLIFEHAEGKPLTANLRSRMAARVAALKLETITPYFGSLARDPVHPSAYYLAVDGANSSPQLLYLGLGNAPTSSTFHNPLLIGRIQRMNGPEFVINATPFGAADHAHIESFAANIDTAFLPRPQGSRASITVAADAPGAFHIFRTIYKRAGKNLAAISAGYHAGLWSAIRAGWRQEYSAVAAIAMDTATESVRETLAFTRFTVDVSGLPRLEPALKTAEYVHEQIRQARAVLKAGGGFEFEVGLGEITPEDLQWSLEWLKAQGHPPQFVTVCGTGDLEGLAAVARQQKVTLSFRYGGEGGKVVEEIARATEGRLNYHVSTPAEAEFIAEYLI